jgi:hypothetical protein
MSQIDITTASFVFRDWIGRFAYSALRLLQRYGSMNFHFGQQACMLSER